MRAVGLGLASCALGAAALACALAWSSTPAHADIVAPSPSELAALEKAAAPPTAPPGPAKASAGPAPAAPSAAAPASAAPGPSAPNDLLPPFEAEAFGDETSKSPTPEEWKTAKELAPTRRSGRADRCHVWRVREWVRVSCPDLVTASLAMLGGTPTGMSFWIDPPKEGSGGKLPAGGEVMFPVRKGDRRVVQFLSFGPGYEGPFTQLPALVVQELWLETAAAPTLLLY